jgi:hypothetical protein
MLSYYDTTDKTKNYDFSKEGIGRWEAKNVKNLAQQSSPAQNDQQLASTGKSMAGENKDTGSGAVHGRGYAKGLIAALFIASGALGGGWFVWKRARGQK